LKSKESRLIYGCMGLGGNWDHGPITPEHVLQARDVVATALEMGICTFDHADVYTFGKAEKVFGQLIKEDKGLRNKVTLQSKAGIRIPGLKEEDTVGYYDLSKEYLSAQVEQSLKNLCTDYLDVFLFHRPDPLVRVEEVAELVEKLYSSGKVKAFGVSNMSGPQIRYWQTILPQPLVVNQIQMSLGHRDFIEAGVSFNHASSPEARWFSEGTLDTCRELGLEIQAWSPLHEGVFTGRPPITPSFRRPPLWSGTCQENISAAPNPWFSAGFCFYPRLSGR
jgi:predicted oxidoreductase